MRTITQPPPSSRCKHCGGKQRFKLIEAADRGLDLEYEIFVCENCEYEIFVCANCGREPPLTVSHDKEIPHINVA